MEAATATQEVAPITRHAPLSPRMALVFAAWFGLVGGYFDLGMIFLKKDVFHATLYYEQSKHFRWTVPLANLVVLMAVGLIVAALGRVRPGLVNRRSAVWLFGTLAVWGPLLRAPLYGIATLLVAAGVARWLSRWTERHPAGFRSFATFGLVPLVAAVIVTAALSLRHEAFAESRAIARLPAPQSGAQNVLLIVMDTVRAESLSLYGYARHTTPNLARWAKQGVRFEWALAPAPWTFPSHCSFLTGQWPSTLNAHWLPTLEPSDPTLAELLASRGFFTAGFAANTNWCSYESGMNRGFVHYEDYPLTPRTILGSTLPGRWILTTLVNPGDYYNAKWVRSQSRDAQAVNRAFLDWLSGGRPSARPFFAFLNYLDAHEPFLPPRDEVGHFGLSPRSPAENTMLLEYWDRDKLKLSARDVELARDSYDNCIAALDRRVGALLDELERRGVLRDTHVIITSDHGEQFGEHGVFNHGFSVYAHEVHVPLLIISPSAPAGRVISEPVSLRDIPATAVALAGVAGSPLPGRSLADGWQTDLRGTGRSPSRALSEVDIPAVILPQRGRGPNQRGFTVSLVAEGLHYTLDTQGNEEIYDLASDPNELRNLVSAPDQKAALARMRSTLYGSLAVDHTESGVAGEYLKRLRMLLASKVGEGRS
jgi:arylsulfatase A-like enzyme